MSNNDSKIILDLCGGSGAWSLPYRKACYDVRNITLPDFDVRTFEPPENVYGILAAPPCTMFSFARTRAKTPRDFSQGIELVAACLKIIWSCRAEGNLKFWALENPTGYLRQFLGKPAFVFEPWQFGENYTKPTDIWGYFKSPKRFCSKPKTTLRSISDFTGGRQNAKRAITPKGFAEAFFNANQ